MAIKLRINGAQKYAADKKLVTATLKTECLQTFGCTRKVYNLYVDYLYDYLEKQGFVNGKIPKIDLPEVTFFKNQEKYKYLKTVDALALANAKINFEDAVKRYNEKCDHKSYTKRALRRDKSGKEPLSFRGLKGMPKFHSRARGDFSYTTNNQKATESNKQKQDTIRLVGNMLHLPKLKEDIPLIIHRPLPEGAEIKNVTVSMDAKGDLYVSVCYEIVIKLDDEIREAVLNGDESIVDKLTFLGLDYSQEDFYVDSEGGKANYPKYYKKSEEKLAKLQRELSHMVEGSNNYKKKLEEIKRLHRKIANQRKDFLQKLSTELVKLYDVIVVEDIDLRAMGETLSLGKNLHDNGFGMFRDMLSYKLERKGSVLVKIDRWYPSSKTCHECGYVNPDVTLGVDEWTCPSCGMHHDRDENAAINIREEGKLSFIEYFANWLAEDEKKRAKAKALSDGRKARKKKAA